uniref:Uncharacterized protein n=1 Tax=Saccharum spontaneum TaxID=62335 RepID=A0A678T6A2_SACSP|nr:hypothetical protein SS34H08_000014 [Saccharum spontaneum]
MCFRVVVAVGLRCAISPFSLGSRATVPPPALPPPPTLFALRSWWTWVPSTRCAIMEPSASSQLFVLVVSFVLAPSILPVGAGTARSASCQFYVNGPLPVCKLLLCLTVSCMDKSPTHSKDKDEQGDQYAHPPQQELQGSKTITDKGKAKNGQDIQPEQLLDSRPKRYL